jgi:hypothetical protein
MTRSAGKFISSKQQSLRARQQQDFKVKGKRPAPPPGNSGGRKTLGSSGGNGAGPSTQQSLYYTNQVGRTIDVCSPAGRVAVARGTVPCCRVGPNGQIQRLRTRGGMGFFGQNRYENICSSTSAPRRGLNLLAEVAVQNLEKLLSRPHPRGLNLLAEVAVQNLKGKGPASPHGNYGGNGGRKTSSSNGWLWGSSGGNGAGPSAPPQPLYQISPFLAAYPKTAQYLQGFIPRVPRGSGFRVIWINIIKQAKNIISRYFEDGGFQKDWFKKKNPSLSDYHKNLLESLERAFLYLVTNPRKTIRETVLYFAKRREGFTATDTTVENLITKLLQFFSQLFVGQPRLAWRETTADEERTRRADRRTWVAWYTRGTIVVFVPPEFHHPGYKEGIPRFIETTT